MMDSRTNFRLLSVLIICTVCASACADSPKVRAIDIDAPLAIVAGLPMPVELLVRGELELVAPSLLDDGSSFTINFEASTARYSFQRRNTLMIRRAGSPAHVSYDQAGGDDPNYMIVPRLSIRIPEDSRARLLLDLTHLNLFIDGDQIQPSDITPGEYRIRLGLPPESALHGRNATVRIQTLNQAERRMLDRLNAIESDRPKWETFILNAEQVLDGLDFESFSEAGRQQMSYYILLAELVHDEREIAELRIDDEMIPPNMWIGYVPAVLLLRLEIAVAAGDADAVALVKEVIRLQGGVPGETLDRVEAGGGIIQSLRSRLSDSNLESATIDDQAQGAHDD